MILDEYYYEIVGDGASVKSTLVNTCARGLYTVFGGVAPPAGGARYAFGTIYPSDTIYKYDMFRCAKHKRKISAKRKFT